MQPGRSRSQLARRAKRPSLRLETCRNSEPHFPEAGVLRTAPPALAAGRCSLLESEAPNLCRFRAAERAVWPVGRAGSATSQ
eukprot:9183927-Alexandrium_andersonii.AAC.1